jgi:hypothetical protein
MIGVLSAVSVPAGCQHFVTASVDRDNWPSSNSGFVSGLTVNSVAVVTSSFPCYPIPHACDVFANCTSNYDVSTLVTGTTATITLSQAGVHSGSCPSASGDNLRARIVLEEVRSPRVAAVQLVGRF